MLTFYERDAVDTHEPNNTPHVGSALKILFSGR
jgi:hypothetical protein